MAATIPAASPAAATAPETAKTAADSKLLAQHFNWLNSFSSGILPLPGQFPLSAAGPTVEPLKLSAQTKPANGAIKDEQAQAVVT